MIKRFLKLIPAVFAFGGLFFTFSDPLSNGREILAQRQFEAAKKCFNDLELFRAERLAYMAQSNSPLSADPWILLGHCFFLQGQDQAALYHYVRAFQLDPTLDHLTPFLQRLRLAGASTGKAPLLAPDVLPSLEKKIGQMIMVSVPGTELSDQKREMLRAGWVGGIILFNQNIRTKTQVKEYVKELQLNAPVPLFVAVDQEGGEVRRFREDQGFQPLPSLASLGETQNPKLAYRFGLLSGKKLKAVGANLNLAPVVDIDREIPGSIISRYRRSLGKDPEEVSKMALQIVRGMRKENVIATAKHFPTQSVVSVNTHDRAAVTDISLSELESEDLLPYRRLIQSDMLDAVMLSHIIYKNIDPYFPASLSPQMIQNLLRGQMGYKGLVISDDLRMEAIKGRFPLEVSVVQAVNAGVDVLLVTDNLEKRVMEGLIKAVQTGKVPVKTIEDAYNRIMAIKGKYGILASASKKMKARTSASRVSAVRKPAKSQLVFSKKPASGAKTGKADSNKRIF